MILEDIQHLVNTDEATALCLSKGGWEGWLQCQLWLYLTIEKDVLVEREVSYPDSNTRCDLVIEDDGDQLWIEIKAYGIFRESRINSFLDGVALDISKLEDRPAGTTGLVTVVVPNAIAESFYEGIKSRHWLGFEVEEGEYAVIFYMFLGYEQ